MPGEQLVLAPEELERVRGERLDLHPDHGPGLGHRRLHQVLSQRCALGHHGVAEVEGLLIEPDDGTVRDLDQHVLPDPVDDRDARVEQQLRAEVGVTPGDADRGVDHGRDLAPDKLLGAHPVQVGVVDDGDLAGAEALGDVLRPLVDARDSHDPGRLPSLTPVQQRKLHGRRLHRVPSCQSRNAPMAMLVTTACHWCGDLTSPAIVRGVPQGTT